MKAELIVFEIPSFITRSTISVFCVILTMLEMCRLLPLQKKLVGVALHAIFEHFEPQMGAAASKGGA